MALTKAMSMEGAPHNVLVNSLHVGVIVSDQIVRRHDREGPMSARRLHRAGRRARADGPHGPRRGVRQCRDFLASDAASYVTGCAINVDGGRSPVV